MSAALMLPTLFLLGAAIGMYVGGKLRNEAWSSNARQPMRIFYRGQGYKVRHAAEDEVQP